MRVSSRAKFEPSMHFSAHASTLAAQLPQLSMMMRGKKLHWKMIKGPQIRFAIVGNTAVDDYGYI